ncbi:MAG: putative inorganic carbon transporter subunit DabA, partial [Limnobacter sp.]
PLRLTVVIDAPANMIQAVIQQHVIVQQLINNGWLHLWRFAPCGFERHESGQWIPVIVD